jgi:exopolysaccharide production protein ExoQ
MHAPESARASVDSRGLSSGRHRHALNRRQSRRRRPAELGSIRGVLWGALGAVVFLGMSNPSILEPHTLTTFRWLSYATIAVVVIDCRRVRLPRMPILVLAFLGFCLLTLLWTPDTGATWGSFLFYAGMAVMAALLVENMSGALFVRSVAMGAVLVMALSWRAVWIDNPSALGPSGSHTVLQGLYGNRNILSYIMVLGLAGLLADRYKTWAGHILKWGLVLAALGTMYAVRSGTGTVAAVLLVVVALSLAALQRMAPRPRRSAGVGLLIAGALGLVALLVNLQRILDLLGKNATFSGRTPLWGGIIDVWVDAPVGGYGWGSVWAYAWYQIDDSAVRERINAFVGYPLNHGHNAVLDILVQVGVVGTLLYVAIVVVSLVRGSRGLLGRPTPERTWIILAMLAVIVCGITEPLFAAPIGWFLVVSASCRAAWGLDRGDETDGRLAQSGAVDASGGSGSRGDLADTPSS